MEHGGVSHYKEFLIVLGAAGIVVPFFIRLGVSPILGFLLVGVLLSPDVLGQIAGQVPSLNALMLTDRDAIASLGELGVVFLLFLIGLELSLERLLTMRRLVFGLGGLQVFLTVLVIAVAAWWLGAPPPAAIVVGTALSLSSTAIVIQLLSDAKRLGSQAGRLSFAILLFQDLAVVPILLLVTILGRETQGPVLQSLAVALVQAALAIALIVGVGRYALRPLLRLAASAKSSDLFMAATLLIAVGAAAVAAAAGLSMALGAFIAGLMLAETEYRRAIEAIIEPFKGLLLGAFFLLVGLGVDLGELVRNPLPILAMALALIAGKAALIYGLARLFGQARGPSAEAAFLLGPCGEFGFVVLGSALSLGVVSREVHATGFLAVSLTMVAIPLLGWMGRRMSITLKGAGPVAAAPQAVPPGDHQPRVIIAGFGRVGHLVGSMLDEHKIPYIAIDSDPELVTRERREGRPVYYGDASQPAFLRHCGIAEARAIAITMDVPARVDDVAKAARAERADLKIVARARDERHAMRLYMSGVTEAVPETIESSLQLGEALLIETGIPIGLAIASVHERRDGFRKLLGRPNRREALELARKRRRRQIE